ncbi:transposase [Polaribacter aquimarinus]|uniref:Transposase n=1 Tax=Polaribacter aquimarinus TaxID=2100726 RepID=A0A2U2JEU5_9FLAO|nr:transposase [Polaribacter aquimarinus]PWG06844.1 transposase [Polaribacter aquimarinus]
MKTEKILTDNYYHIYNRGNNGDDIFYEEKNYDYFLILIKKYLLPICEIYAYCLLKNHFHILLRIKDTVDNPSQHFSNLFNAYTKAMNKKYNRTGSLFEKPFKRIKITDENYLKTLILYIHLNPEHHQISKDFNNYKYSSYKSIISSKETHIQRNTVLEYFDGIDNFTDTHLQRKIFVNERNMQLFLE